MDILTTNQLEAYDAGTKIGADEGHPLTVYIEEGNYVVTHGREKVLTTDCVVALMSFMNGWKLAYLKT